MTSWDEFVARGGADAAQLVEAAGQPGRLAELGLVAFRIGLASLLLGADDVGRLALAIERAIDRLPGPPAPALVDAIGTLRDALVQLAQPDKSGARVEGLPLEERRRALEGDGTPVPVPVPVASAAPVPVASAAPVDERLASPMVSPPEGTRSPGFAWTPSVDDDMLDLFFDEAAERVAALAGKLVDIERRPDDRELLRDVFRDLHTVKGSSAMVGLAPVNQLAHAAE
ncbi:MAG TPA: Hpt domain-containing protein, partial [Kofleriaceae bacterium]